MPGIDFIRRPDRAAANAPEPSSGVPRSERLAAAQNQRRFARRGVRQHVRRVWQDAGVGRSVDVDELVGAAEIAARLGVKRLQVVHDWRRRHGEFPQPLAAISRTLVWYWPDVRQWAVRTGRLDGRGQAIVTQSKDDEEPCGADDSMNRTQEGSIDEHDDERCAN